MKWAARTVTLGTRVADPSCMVLSVDAEESQWLACEKKGGSPVRAPLTGRPGTR